MENLFERTFFVRVAKYYGAKFLSIQVSVGRKDLLAKFATNLFLHFRKIYQRVRRVIGTKKPGRRKERSHTIAKSGFTRGDSASDSDRRHGSGT
jgi:hypothetical protein